MIYYSFTYIPPPPTKVFDFDLAAATQNIQQQPTSFYNVRATDFNTFTGCYLLNQNWAFIQPV